MYIWTCIASVSKHIVTAALGQVTELTQHALAANQTQCLIKAPDWSFTLQFWTPLMLACYEGHLDIAQMLLSSRADVSAMSIVSCLDDANHTL